MNWELSDQLTGRELDAVRKFDRARMREAFDIGDVVPCPDLARPSDCAECFLKENGTHWPYCSKFVDPANDKKPGKGGAPVRCNCHAVRDAPVLNVVGASTMVYSHPALYASSSPRHFIRSFRPRERRLPTHLACLTTCLILKRCAGVNANHRAPHRRHRSMRHVALLPRQLPGPRNKPSQSQQSSLGVSVADIQTFIPSSTSVVGCLHPV